MPYQNRSQIIYPVVIIHNIRNSSFYGTKNIFFATVLSKSLLACILLRNARYEQLNQTLLALSHPFC
jgi:hypothetical protein